MKSPYEVLGLPEDAPEKDVKAAYKKLAFDLHPDRNGGDIAKEERFKDVNTAYQSIVSGDYLRKKQEASMRGGSWHFNFGHMPDDLNDIFATMQARQRQRNNDLHVEFRISLEDAFTGKEVTFKLRQEVEREITVKIPPGIEDGGRLRVPQGGDRTFPGLAPGDLYVIVRVLPHPAFHVASPNLVSMVNIGVFEALLGTDVTIQGIDGTHIKVVVPALSSHGAKLRVAGHGMPTFSDGRGDLIVVVNVVFPESLTEEQVELLSKAAGLPKTENASNL